jgi:hypothetical protein
MRRDAEPSRRAVHMERVDKCADGLRAAPNMTIWPVEWPEVLAILGPWSPSSGWMGRMGMIFTSLACYGYQGAIERVFCDNLDASVPIYTGDRMGWSYDHVTVYGSEQHSIEAFLRRTHRRAIVSPTVAGYTVVYAHHGYRQFGHDPSTFFSCPALRVSVHDSDAMHSSLFAAGTPVDVYDSSPGYFGTDDHGGATDVSGNEDGETPIGGDAARLCRLLGAPGSPGDVDAVLRHKNGRGSIRAPEYWYPQERHERLVRALGLPVFTEDLIHWRTDRLSELIYRGAPADTGDPSAYVVIGTRDPERERVLRTSAWELYKRHGRNMIRPRQWPAR